MHGQVNHSVETSFKANGMLAQVTQLSDLKSKHTDIDVASKP